MNIPGCRLVPDATFSRQMSAESFNERFKRAGCRCRQNRRRYAENTQVPKNWLHCSDRGKGSVTGCITVTLKPFYFLRVQLLHVEALAGKPVAQMVQQID